MVLHHVIHLCRLKMDPSLVYLPSSIFQIIYCCLNEWSEQMEVLCRPCEYQVILLPFLVTGICCSMKLDIWKWLILDSGNFWMPHLHKRICIQWRGRLDHVRGTLFFTLVYGSEFAVMVCYTWVWLYCLQVAWSVRVFLLLDENVGSGYLLQEYLPPIFNRPRSSACWISLQIFQFCNTCFWQLIYVFMLKQIDTWRQRCSCTRLMIRVLMCSPLPSLFRRYWKAELAIFSYDIEQSITSKVSWPWESQ